MAGLTDNESSIGDVELVDRVRRGDEMALSELYRRYVAPIYRFVLAQVRHVPDAEDLTSETFAKMLRGIDDFRGDASFKNWLYQIARNTVRNHRRRTSYRMHQPLRPETLVTNPRGPESGRNDKETEEAVLRLLKPLPPRYRRVLELRFLEGRSIQATAQAMGITISNAKVLQHRALKKASAMEEERVASGRQS